MAAPLLLSVKNATIRYSEIPVFEDLSFNIHERARIALVGSNGAGKSTLMNIITGTQDMDEGERWEENGVSIGYLRQDIKPTEGQSVFDYIFCEFTDEDRELHLYKVDIIADALHLNTAAQMSMLSGGQLRRAGLARCLVEEPDILLLDEPTNHLDLEVIEWLEGYLKSYRGTLLCISHDRTFLSNVTNQVFWLDRGNIRVSPRGFAHFEEWSTMLLEQEERELHNRTKLVNQEVAWANKGVKARRKRNVRRVEQMKMMRDKLQADQSAYRKATSKISIEPIKDLEASSKIVAEFYNVCKGFEIGEQPHVILDKFCLRIARGDRIGILGKNGSGKTTFLKLLLGELTPDQGRVKRRKELEFSYFDQKRSDLNPEDSLRKVLAPGGGDYIDVMGKERHVCGYLRDFLFDPARVQDKVSQLSGGQKNRLMLAKILANPKTCLILDEPTNDLDMDTLDMLEEILCQYKGTLIIVSHDRDFLDQTVSKILAFEGEGEVETHIGGYSDYLAAKQGTSNAGVRSQSKAKGGSKDGAKNGGRSKEKKSSPSQPPAKQEKPEKPAQKLTFKLEHELKTLPKKIKEVEKKLVQYRAALDDPDLYQRDPDEFHTLSGKLVKAEDNLEYYETRWIELEEMKMGGL